MACVEHTCNDCGHWWFNNLAGEDCPLCGSSNTFQWFDEDFSGIIPEPVEEDEEEEF